MGGSKNLFLLDKGFVFIEIELEPIKYFLDKTLKIVDEEIDKICKREEAGEFLGLDDFDNALFFPMNLEEIAIRAVFHEINALIEWELQNVASEPYFKSSRYAKTRKRGCSETISDLSIRKVRRLIEQHYTIDLSSLSGATEIENVRKIVNAFKHRKGFKDSRRDSCSNKKFPESYELNRNDAYKAIEGARVFLRALTEITKTSPLRNNSSS